jgi:hypothetical protein
MTDDDSVSQPSVVILSRQFVYTLIVAYVAVTIATWVSGITYSNYRADLAADRANHQWCQTLTIYHNVYHGHAPVNSSAQGKELIEALERQYKTFHCE